MVSIQIFNRIGTRIQYIIMPANSRTERPLTFDLINVFTNYPNLQKSIWPASGEII